MNNNDYKNKASGAVNSTFKSIQSLIDALPPIHRAGWPFIAIAGVITILCALFSGFLFTVGLVLTLFCVYFFRDPIRYVPTRDGLLVSPADGVVSQIMSVPLPDEFELDEDDQDTVTRISIFLNVFDVHVQRVPIKGTVSNVSYRPGKFLNASLDKASDDNERSSTLITLDDGRHVAFVQIAGLIARRIINHLKPGDVVSTGHRYGLIRFGSRVDIYLPTDTVPLVNVGQRMIGGETILADLTSKEEERDAHAV